jgi:hypothetical protein
MQWQTIADAKSKDRWKRQGCAGVGAPKMKPDFGKIR